MRLQQKQFTFNLVDGNKTMSDILRSNVVINNKLSNVLVSQLFYDNVKQKNNTLKGYSILEFVDEQGNISVNEKIYNITFTGDKDNFILKSVTEPTGVVMNDKELKENESKVFEELLTNSTTVDEQEQPLEQKTDDEVIPAVVTLFKNEDYESEKESNENFIEYNTEPVSNLKLLVNESELPETQEDVEEKLVLIEIESEQSFSILIREEYKIELNQENKTFTFEKILE